MKIDFEYPQRIVMLAGPSGCGKSYFCRTKLFSWVESKAIPFHYLSSDVIRRDLLHASLSKFDRRMDYASEQAFVQLYSRLDSLTKYPINSGMVILDATFLQKEAREKVLEIAKRNHYPVDLIAFDFKDRDDYTKHLTHPDEKATASRHIQRFRKRFWAETKRKEYAHHWKIKKFDEEVSFEFSSWDLWKRCQLDSNYEYITIGDVHGCLTELKLLIEKHGFKVENGKVSGGPPKTKFILLGDYVDKGPDCTGVVNFIYDNQDFFKLVLGNHENFCYKWLKGKLKDIDLEEEVRKTYFSCTEEFKDQDTQEKFFHLVENSSPFLKGEHFIVTHADCNAKYLGKLDKASLREQRTTRVIKRKDYDSEGAYLDAREKQLVYLSKESTFNWPYQIFGHHALKKNLTLKTRICIDTGCVHGGKLTSVVVNPHGKPYFSSVPLQGESIAPEELATLFERKPVTEVKLSQFEGFELRRLRKLTKHKVNFISGTMSPPDRDLEKETLESIETALAYYRTRKVNRVVLQPKWMGSRGNLYLNCQSPEESFLVSRGGYVVKEFDEKYNFGVKNLSSVYPATFKQLEEIGTLNLEKYQWLALDGELMPWHALGEGLIEKTFKTVGYAIDSELTSLQEEGFFDNLKELTDSYEKSGFAKEGHLSRKELAKKYGHHILSNHTVIKDFSQKDPTWLRTQVDRYNEQIKIYGSPGELEYKPFSVLKAIVDEEVGKEELFFEKGNSWCYKAVAKEPCLELDLEDPEAVAKGEEFFNDLTLNKKMEGVVVKPADDVFLPKIAPFLKVRNPNYLTIIYGYDYEHPPKYKKLLHQKNVRGKILTSANEFELGKKLLEIPRKDISKQNQEYINLVAAFITEEKKEKELDPRL